MSESQDNQNITESTKEVKKIKRERLNLTDEEKKERLRNRKENMQKRTMKINIKINTKNIMKKIKKNKKTIILIINQKYLIIIKKNIKI